MRPDDQVAMANHIARQIKKTIPPTHGFCLFLFPHSSQPGHGLTTYIASVERADMRHELRLVLAKWDADELERGPMRTTEKSLGQRAFETFWSRFGGQSQDWQKQQPEISQAWEAAAAAVKAGP